MAQPTQTVVAMANIPSEIILLILKHIPDVATLASAVQCSPLFYRVFNVSAHSVAKAVLSREIGGEVRPEALLIPELKANPIQPPPKRRWGMSKAELDAIEKRPAHSETVTALLRRATVMHESYRWSLGLAVAAARLHSCVRSLAHELASTSLHELANFPTSMACVERPMEPQPSSQELRRIERALYRFELFCHLFPTLRDFSRSDIDGGVLPFLSAFPLWEIEQLACVYDFLCRQILPAYHDMVAHDIAWGRFGVDSAERDFRFNGQFQAILAQGLHHIHSIAQAKTFDDRFAILGTGDDRSPEAYFFLESAFSIYNSARSELMRASGASVADVNEMSLFSPLTIPRLLRDKSDAADADAGPEKVWVSTYFTYSYPKEVMDPEAKHLRAGGYVFWDEARLQTSGLLAPDWDRFDDYVIAAEELARKGAPTDDELSASIIVRKKLFKAGKRGFWNGEECPDEVKTVPAAVPSKATRQWISAPRREWVVSERSA